jgi:pimeloyl-ACP methyl ester carboxylesterase
MSQLEYVEANDLRFALFDQGSGPLVLLLHGFPDTARTWDRVRPALVDAGYRVVAPFMRGYAPTERPDRAPTAETLGRDALALIEACGESRARVVGHDWGAVAAYAAAMLAPERVERLLTAAVPHPGAVKPSPRLLWHVRHFINLNLPGAARRLRRDDFAYVETLFRRWSPHWDCSQADVDAVRESLSQPGSAEAAVSYYRMLLRPSRLFRRKIEVPTRVISGVDDTAVRPASFESAERFFEDTYEVITLPGGHFVHRERPEAFIEAVLEWLD